MAEEEIQDQTQGQGPYEEQETEEPRRNEQGGNATNQGRNEGSIEGRTGNPSQQRGGRGMEEEEEEVGPTRGAGHGGSSPRRGDNRGMKRTERGQR